MTANVDITLRAMTKADLAACHALSQSVQWPHRQEDWALFLHLGDGLVAECDGAIVGTTMSCCYGSNAAVIGMVIVSESIQGHGLGRRLMEAIMAPLGDRALFLMATDAGLPLYQKLGFVDIGQIQQRQSSTFLKPKVGPDPNSSIRPAEPSDLSEILALDLQSQGLDRRALLLELIRQSQVMVIEDSQGLTGFGILRAFGRGHSIGPIVARDVADAQTLFAHFLSINHGHFTRIDVYGDAHLESWLDQLGMSLVGTGVCMIKGERPPKDTAIKTWSVVNQAFG
jgi:predicted N-acetyltransferase YhbS